MGPHVPPEGALGGGRLLVGNIGGWLNAYVLCVGSAFCTGHDFVATMREALLWRLPGCGAARIHVSAVSDRWLRMHECDYDKHRTEL